MNETNWWWSSQYAKKPKRKNDKKRQSHLEVCLSEFFRRELQVSATQKGRTDVIPHPDLKKIQNAC